MRIHVQNTSDDPAFAITPAMWAAADGQGDVSFGETEAEFHAGVAEADVLLTATAALKAYYPCPSPKLKMIFCASAGNQ